MKNTLKYIMIFIFLISALLKIMDFENTVLLFTDILDLPHKDAKTGLIVIIVIELLISLVILKSWCHKKSIYYACLIVFCSFIILNISLLSHGVQNCGCMGTLIISDPLFSLIKSTLMLVLFVFISSESKQALHE